ncbi:MAG: divergent polysaccharide deacetylase family protein [Spirochaetes bacterium]|nr:divergent polysaccharide deacetylase family protein [Spirochaetota bacterium]MBU0953917.1 divergent polysaccharide deacetylase family protein [Spirochaetota bacterium]
MAKRKKKGRFGRAWLALYSSVLLVGLALVLALLFTRNSLVPPVNHLPPLDFAPVESQKPEVRPHFTEDKAPADTAPRLIIVLDDAGHNLWQLEPFLALPFPLTIAVLPGLPYTAKAAELIKAAGKEVLLHQPMEALNGLDPGPGSISSSMDEQQIRQILRANMAQVPSAVGMNNHMGSLATSDPFVMNIVLDEAKRAGWYFLDSLTIGTSVAAELAAAKKTDIWERTVFLDNSPDRDYIVNKMNEGSRVAEKHGYAIMIGHVWTAELAQTLSELYPQLIEQGFSLSTIARMLMEKDDADSGN